MLPLAIIVLNYRTSALVVEALHSLAGQIQPEREQVLIVDNASGDGSPDRIRAAIQSSGWSGWARVLESEHNGGYSAGNNLGITALQAESYLLLNSDTLVQPGALTELHRAMREHPEVDLFGPRIELKDGSVDCSAFRLPSAWSELDRSARTGFVSRLLERHVLTPPVPEQPAPFDWASFACILIRRRVFERIGLLDEGYFLYFEDVDFCHRARKAGFRGLYWPSACVVHLEGGSGPVQANIAQRGRPPAYYYASRSRYFAKFHGRGGLVAANLMWYLGRTLSWPREILAHKAPHLCQKEGWDIWKRVGNPVDPPERWTGSLG